MQSLRVIHVSAKATGHSDGTTWADAYVDLQDALDDARASGDLDAQIWIAAGIYKPDRGTRDRGVAFELFGTIAIYGGFEGREECLDERDTVSNASILTGDLIGDDDLEVPVDSDCCIFSYYPAPLGTCTDADCRATVLEILPSCATRWTQSCTGVALDYCCELCRPTLCDNTQNVIRTVEPGSAPRLDGLTITAGEAGATSSEPYLPPAGGGIWSYLSSPAISGCVFTHHGGGSGAAFHSTFGSPVFDRSTFFENRNSAVRIQQPKTSVGVNQCSFVANRGGGLEFSIATATAVDCVFRSNGTGIRASDASVNIVSCEFANNLGLGASVGSSSYVRLDRSVFKANRSGGLQSFGVVEVVDSVFSANQGSLGAAMFSWGALVVRNSSIIGNTGSGRTGGIWADGPTWISSSILWGNTDTESDDDEIAQLYSVSTPPVMKNNIVQGWTGRWGGVDNSGADPLFVDPDGADDIPGTEDDDLRLSPDSPAINAGDPNFVPFTNETDLDGHMRVLCERVDIGAYEFGIGDYDCNRTVDLTDFAGWQGCITGPTNPVASARGSDLQSTIGCQAFDFNADGAVDLLDLQPYLNLLTGR